MLFTLCIMLQELKIINSLDNRNRKAIIEIKCNGKEHESLNP